MTQSGAGVFTIDNNEATSGSIEFKANNSGAVEQTILTLDGDDGAKFTANIQFPGVGPSVSYIEFVDTSNILDQDKWTGQIETVNTSANLTHYLNFSDSSATGYGRPQKNASISCNPSTGTITATTFSGSISNAAGVSLTSDNTSGTYYLPFSKTTTATGNALYIDNTTTPLTYNPNSSTLTASIFSGSASQVRCDIDNTSTVYYPAFATGAGIGQSLKVDVSTTPLTYQPDTSTLTASNFNGLSSSSTTAVGVNLTSDNSPTTCYIPFTKTTTATGNSLYMDDATTPLTYVPNSSTLTASVFDGSATTTAITDTNTNATFYPVFVSASGSGQTLRADIASGPLFYNPSTAVFFATTLSSTDTQFGSGTSAITSFTAGTLTLAGGNVSFKNFSWVLTGGTNNMTALTLSSGRINGVFNVGIINNGSGSLTINNTGLGLNTLCSYTAPVVVLAGNLAVMTINVLSVNTITRIIVDAYNVSP
jgi:hypothetical protein